MAEDRLFGLLRGRVLPVLLSVAAVLVSIAAVVLIVDTLRDEADDDGRAPTARLGGDGLDDLDDLRERLPGLVARGGGALLGVTFTEDGDAVVVEDVLPGSPAEDAGLAAGDVIAAVDGAEVHSGAELREALAAIEPGASYELTLERDGEERTVAVVRPEADLFEAFVAPGGGPLLGVTTEDTADGVRVRSVLPGLGAEEAGIEEGDLIRSVDGVAVETTAALRELLAEREPDEVVAVELLRVDEPLEVRVALSEPRRTPRGPFGFVVPDEDQSFEFDGLTPEQADQFGFFLDGLAPEQRERLERIIEELLDNGYAPPRAVPGERAGSGA